MTLDHNEECATSGLIFASQASEVFSGSKTKDLDDPQTTVVHIRKQIRSGRLSLTIVEGLSSELDLKKIVKLLKRQFATNGVIKTDDEFGEVLQFQGDFRDEMRDFLVTHGICERRLIRLHGE